MTTNLHEDHDYILKIALDHELDPVRFLNFVRGTDINDVKMWAKRLSMINSEMKSRG